MRPKASPDYSGVHALNQASVPSRMDKKKYAIHVCDVGHWANATVLLCKPTRTSMELNPGTRGSAPHRSGTLANCEIKSVKEKREVTAEETGERVS